jgi:hypothetical protein
MLCTYHLEIASINMTIGDLLIELRVDAAVMWCTCAHRRASARIGAHRRLTWWTGASSRSV